MVGDILCAIWRGVKIGLGFPVEPIDYSPEAQLRRAVERLQKEGQE